jgi:hypothetical protein
VHELGDRAGVDRAGFLAGLPDGPRSFALSSAPCGHRARERLNAPLSSNQAKVAHARGPAAADDQVLVHGHAERSGGLDDVSGDGDVRIGRGGIARGLELERPLAKTAAAVAAHLCAWRGRLGAFTPGAIFGPELAAEAAGESVLDQAQA